MMKRLILAVCCLLPVLSACQTSLITDLAARPGDVLYRDDFSDSSGNWPTHSLPEGAFGYADGTYAIHVISSNYQLWAVSGQMYRDAVVEVDATRLAGPLVNLFGLVCRYQDGKNFYFFIISSDGYFGLGKMKNGVSSLLGQGMMAYSRDIVQGGGTNHLAFTCIGDALGGAVNGQVVALTRDSDFATGDAGLLAGSFDEGGVQVSFDNFLVSNP
jgi:hypothetical protein